MSGTHDVTRVLLIFLDGVGIGVKDRHRNPFFHAPLPFLTDALGGIPSARRHELSGPLAACTGVDATLGIAGLPQSGTGQTALYTGRNAARLVGRHFGPYVYSTLRPVLQRHSIYRQLLDDGVPLHSLALANAFPERFFEYMRHSRRRMVAGMMMAEQAGIPFRDLAWLKAGTAVSTDITAERWKDIGHPDAPVTTPYDAGRRLARIAASHRFTLFEYFRTDTAGHARDMSAAVHCLRDVDELLRGVCDGLPAHGTLALVTSDHGNIEDLSTRTHTRARVPVIALGSSREHVIVPLRRISDLTPALRTFLRRSPH